MDREKLAVINPLILGMVGGALSAFLISCVLLTAQIKGNSFEVVTVDQQILQQRFARLLAEEKLSTSQEEQQIYLFWKAIQQKIRVLHSRKTTLVLARDVVLNMDLKDVTETLWKEGTRSFTQKNANQERRDQE